jgi:hypothetical protein
MSLVGERIVRPSVTICRTKQKVPAMFMLPAYDPTAIAMLGFGVLAVLSLPFIF